MVYDINRYNTIMCFLFTFLGGWVDSWIMGQIISHIFIRVLQNLTLCGPRFFFMFNVYIIEGIQVYVIT